MSHMISEDPALQTRKLTKHYGSFPALVDLDLDVGRGEVFGFLGPNGAGKSTAIRTLLDEIRPTSGSALLLGLDSHRDAMAIRTRIGYLPSDLALYPDLTGKDTLAFFGRLRGGIDRRFVNALAERLDADLTKKVGALSTGNRQKIGLIQCFMHKPQLLIMDEPNAGLDPLVQHEFQTMLREVADEGRTVFLSSHTLSEVQRAADRVGIIRQGRLITVENVAGLRAKAIRRVEMVFDTAPDAAIFETLPGAKDVVVEDHRVRLAFDGDMQHLLGTAIGHYTLLDISTEEADLEDIFLTYYREEAGV